MLLTAFLKWVLTSVYEICIYFLWQEQELLSGPSAFSLANMSWNIRWNSHDFHSTCNDWAIYALVSSGPHFLSIPVVLLNVAEQWMWPRMIFTVLGNVVDKTGWKFDTLGKYQFS